MRAGTSRGKDREKRNGHPAAVIWLTGRPGSGKSTIARAVERRLFEAGCQTMLLDGDLLRHGLNGDLGFSPADRKENIRRVGQVAHLFYQQGCVVVCAFVSPYAEDRDAARELIPDGRFFEVHVACDVATLRARDTKNLYAAAERGAVELTGVTAPYETPVTPELTIDTADLSQDEAIQRTLRFLSEALGITMPT